MPPMLCCVMLCHAMRCYAILCCAVLRLTWYVCYLMLCYAMLCYAMLCYAMLCYAMLAMLCMLCCAVLCLARPCCIAQKLPEPTLNLRHSVATLALQGMPAAHLATQHAAFHLTAETHVTLLDRRSELRVPAPLSWLCCQQESCGQINVTAAKGFKRIVHRLHCTFFLLLRRPRASPCRCCCE